MKKVYQTKFGYPDGNCCAACLASIFEIDIETIPSWGVGSDWYDRFTEWCVENLGLQPIDIEAETCVIEPKGYYLINGESKNGDFWHSAVGMGGKVVHDPHPDGALKNQQTYTFFLKVLDK